MKKLLFILALLPTCICFAQRDKAEAYILQYKDIAIQEMLRSGVPAAITLAQGVLESQFGESELCKKSNNHFGIKCKTEWTGERVYHNDDSNGECFRRYTSAEESYKDHSEFLRTRSHYAFLFSLQPNDSKGWASGLKKAGYATETDYPEKLMKVIEDYNLNQYTLMAMNKQNKPVPKNEINIAKSDAPAAKPTKVAVDTVVVPAPKTLVKAEEKPVPVAAPVIVKPVVEAPAVIYPTGIFTINTAKVIYAKEGTSLLQIADEYKISLAKLLTFNDMEEKDILDKDALIYLEKKAKKGTKDFHVVEYNETLQEIAQTEGIRLESIFEFNGFKNKVQPITGEKIYLRFTAPYSPKPIAVATPASGGSGGK